MSLRVSQPLRPSAAGYRTIHELISFEKPSGAADLRLQPLRDRLGRHQHEGVIALLINMYLCASGITMVVAFVCKRFCHQLTPSQHIRVLLAVLVGALWPVLILGIAALGFVALLTNVKRPTNPRVSDAARVQQDDAGHSQPDDDSPRQMVATPRLPPPAAA
jgi:hypothetical protein